MDENESFRDPCHALLGMLSRFKFMDPELSELKCSSERDVTPPPCRSVKSYHLFSCLCNLHFSGPIFFFFFLELKGNFLSF